ncbi:MAG: glycine--tRNA ligase [Candidatus Anstonellaceae archaeon]
MAKAQQLMDIAIRRAILIPSCEIYGSPAGFYDYGPVGCAIKHNIENLWRKEMLQKEGFHEIETSLILPEVVLKASGHLENFADPIVYCASCNQRFRADHLIESHPEAKLQLQSGADLQKLSELIQKYAIACPSCKKQALSKVSWFNLMFKTNIGPIEGNSAYFRPETAQGIFMDFLRIIRNFGGKLPIGIGQVGKSARNEISPRQGLMRMREFTQMELEYFFDPAQPTHPKFEEIANDSLRIASEGGAPAEIKISEAVSSGLIPNQIMAYLLWKQKQFYLLLGIPQEKFFFRKMPKEETPHYSLGNVDLEVETSYGLIETAGTAYRTDYDLSSHSKFSGQELSVFEEQRKEKVIPHVVEPSMGVDRTFWCVLEHCFREKSESKEWDWFDFPPWIAPYHAWVFPLMKKDGLDKKARQVEELLRKEGLCVFYQESGSIGRRYARADEIGVPYCITIDYPSLENEDVTVRFRNDGKQIRVKITQLASSLTEFVRQGKVTG